MMIVMMMTTMTITTIPDPVGLQYVNIIQGLTDMASQTSLPVSMSVSSGWCGRRHAQGLWRPLSTDG